MKKKILYLSWNAWWDTDATILPSLCVKYDVSFIAIQSLFHGGKIIQDVPSCVTSKIFYETRGRKNIRTFFLTLKFLSYVYRKSSKVDSVFCVYGGNPYLLMLLPTILPVNKTIIGIHNYIEHTDLRRSFFSIIKQFYYKRYLKFCFFSELQKLSFENDFPHKKSYYIQMPLKDFGKPSSNNLSIKRKINLLFFGYIRKYKRLDLLINAFEELMPSNCVLHVVGNCENWEYYNKMIKTQDLYRLSIRFVENHEIPDLFASLDFLVLPYSDATQSGPSLIAINYGLPIIASNLPYYQSIVKDGFNGFLFETNNIQSLMSVLKEVNSLPRNIINQMKQNQQEFKEDYKKRNCIEELLESMFD